jgi:hypothetical protein
LSSGLLIHVVARVDKIFAAFGFNSPEALIALAMLSLGGHKPLLPGRIQPMVMSGEPNKK